VQKIGIALLNTNKISESGEITCRLNRIENVLLLNSSFIDDLGLMHGKTGIAIFFFHLARATGNKIYEDYAGELIDEIYEEISVSTSWDFENGLAGIGWGIEYLAQNGFIEADTDEVLEEFDNRLFQALIYSTPQEVGLLDGLAGLGAYFLKRIQNPASNNGKISTLTNKQILIHLIDDLDRRTQDVSVIIRESQTFDICWDYPILIWFLTELYKLNIFNFKVEKIIKRLIEPLYDDKSLPRLHSNRLLLALAVTKLSNCGIDKQQTKETIDTGINLDIISNKLLTNIDRNTITNELTPNSVFIANGTMGIAWICKQLFALTKESNFKTEMEYWTNQSFSFEEVDKGFAGFAFEDEDNAFGLLEGLAGIGLYNNTILQYDNLTV